MCVCVWQGFRQGDGGRGLGRGAASGREAVAGGSCGRVRVCWGTIKDKKRGGAGLQTGLGGLLE